MGSKQNRGRLVVSRVGPKIGTLAQFGLNSEKKQWLAHELRGSLPNLYNIANYYQIK